ncbi:zf-HC2 domain-containing protein [Streptomyces sp. HUAS MG47]|uniref:zf-HC2 domain-containing protein n=1 Tax=Streptomyces solicamelliae TaxID=3231716 RepID=UPI003877E94F
MTRGSEGNGTGSEGHRDVAAYALGALEPLDALRCAEHLERCPDCAREHVQFAALAAALAELIPPAEPARVPGPVPDRTPGRAAGRRRRWAARAVAWPSVAAVLVVAVLLGDEAPEAVRFSATDRTTGVTASAALTDRDWGAAVGLRVAGLRGGRVCTLYAVDGGGREYPLLTWRAEGVETPLIETGAPMHPAEIAHLTVRDETGTQLADLHR